MDIKVVLITSSVILGCLVSKSMTWRISENYKTLNEHLKSIENPTQNIRIYLEEAKKELQRVRLDPTLYRHGYEKSVDDFIKLETVLDNTAEQCTFEEYEIIESVARETKGHKFTIRPETKPPVKLVVYEVGLSRAGRCKPVWPKKFKAIYWAIPSNVIKLAEFSNWDWLRRKIDTNRGFIKRLINYRYTALDEHIIKIANNHIMRHSQDHPDRCNYRMMIEVCLKRPCIRYRSSLGYLVLMQAKYDAGMFKRLTGFVFSEDKHDDSLMPFYLAMAHNERCRVVDDENFVEEVYRYWWDIQETGDTDCFKKISAETAGTSECKENVGCAGNE